MALQVHAGDGDEQRFGDVVLFALLLFGELGIALDLPKQLANARHVHVSKARAIAARTTANEGKMRQRDRELTRDAHVLHARRRCDLHALHSLRKWNMRRSGCSAANDRISDDVFDGNSAPARHI